MYVCIMYVCNDGLDFGFQGELWNYKVMMKF